MIHVNEATTVSETNECHRFLGLNRTLLLCCGCSLCSCHHYIIIGCVIL